MNIDIEIQDYDDAAGQVRVKYSTVDFPDGYTVNVGLPEVNGEIVTDPAQVLQHLEGYSPRHLFFRAQAVKAQVEKPEAERAAKKAALIGQTRRVPLTIPANIPPVAAQMVNQGAVMRVAKLKEI